MAKRDLNVSGVMAKVLTNEISKEDYKKNLGK